MLRINTDNMEEPTACQRCGELFDLMDGIVSEKWYPNTVICESCGEKEEKEVEQEEEADDLLQTIENAQYEIRIAKKRLDEIGHVVAIEPIDILKKQLKECIEIEGHHFDLTRRDLLIEVLEWAESL